MLAAITFPITLKWASAIVSLVVMEALLSVDNLFAIVAIAHALPEEERKRACAWGMGLGIVFRFAALALAGIIIANPIVRYLGAGYLVWLAIKHFAIPEAVVPEQRGAGHFRKVVLAIAVADIAFSLDNVVAAVGLTSEIILVYIGVGFGILTMYFAASLAANLVHRYPQLKDTAFAIVGFIGLAMIAELALGWPLSEIEKFAAILAMVAVTIAYGEGRRRGFLRGKRAGH